MRQGPMDPPTTLYILYTVNDEWFPALQTISCLKVTWRPHWFMAPFSGPAKRKKGNGSKQGKYNPCRVIQIKRLHLLRSSTKSCNVIEKKDFWGSKSFNVFACWALRVINLSHWSKKRICWNNCNYSIGLIRPRYEQRGSSGEKKTKSFVLLSSGSTVCQLCIYPGGI